ncbi:RNA polymerase sigma-70 factor (ECF subfamily) [Mucilaginibacter gracilis]|uniref:RNA polymerase sigma-70 factor (ECF subfamily) n=1 Tax=Mucilaginibacter gracilis TaxID=423350 RepID=A0A495IUH2_9SPHI|nr:RNA polymerase sigma-70 factor [Mucilaginibacter gracilis]RKR79951.1 RNA polymerase sigma-70 factor (ECF subfamily) [Mucilaginibacter gracilis]
MAPSDYTVLADNELVLLLNQGDLAAFNEIYHRYWGRLFDAAYKGVRDAGVCEDLLQDIFVKLWEKRFRVSFTKGLGNYLYTAVKYKVLDHYRAALVRENFRGTSQPAADYDNSTLERILLVDLIRHIEILVHQLPDKCRFIYRLSRIEHKSNKEIASLLDISEKTVEGHLTKALSRLKPALYAGYLFLIALVFVFHIHPPR